MLLRFLKGTSKLLPVIFVGVVAWAIHHYWLNYFPHNELFANSIEAKDVKVSSKVSGRISKIFIKEGTKVKKGERLLELEGEEIIAQLEQFKSNLAKAHSDLIDLQKGARPQEIIQAEAKTLKIKSLLEETKAKYENALKDYQRIIELEKEGAVSKQTLDKYETQKIALEKEVTGLEQEYTFAKENESLVKEGPRKDQIEALKSQVGYYKAKVREFEKYVDELTVSSPLDGEVSSFDLKVGEVIKAHQTLLTICDLSDIYVRVYVPQAKLAKIKSLQKVNIKADSYPKEIFEGYISYIGAQAEFTPRNVQTPDERSKLVYPVKVQISNRNNKLRDGMYVSVNL